MLGLVPVHFPGYSERRPIATVTHEVVRYRGSNYMMPVKGFSSGRRKEPVAFEDTPQNEQDPATCCF